MAAFGHAHHGHGHSHSHDHECSDHSDSHAHGPHEEGSQKHDHNHDHSHDHHHDHTHNHSHHQLSNHAHGEHAHGEHAHNHQHTHTHEHSHTDHPHITPTPENFDLPPLSAISQKSHLLESPPSGLSPSPSVYASFPATPSKPVYHGSHSHATPSHSHQHTHNNHHHHHHHHGNENMHGIFLHVLADTMGSVAVVISTLLIHYVGWSGFDPIASCIIAVLIFASAIPLVASSASKLLMAVPADTEYDLREALAGLSGLRGVSGYTVPKFWMDEGGSSQVRGVVHVMATKQGDLEDVKERCIAYLKGRGMNVLVQVEREGSGRCWCQATRQGTGY